MVPHKAITNQVGGIRLKLLSLLLLLFSNNLLLITKLTIKTYLQLISLKKKKNIQSKHYLQVISFHKLLFILILKKKFISIEKNSFQLKTIHFD